MNKLLLGTLAAVSLSLATPALAADGRFGLGVETTLNTAAAPNGSVLFVYDVSQWRIDGLFGMGVAGESVNITVGGRFNYVLHSADRADFSIGAGAFLQHAGTGNNGFRGDTTRGEIDILTQMRVFLVPNVALLAGVGMGVSFGEGGVTLSLGGHLTGSFGLAYFF